MSIDNLKSVVRNHVVGELLVCLGKPVDSALIDVVAEHLSESIYNYVSDVTGKDEVNEQCR